MDPNTGSGHRNAVAYLDGKYYIADSGYSGKAPRPFKVYEEKEGFSAGTFTTSQGKTVIYQYDGVEKEVTIPCDLGEEDVEGLGVSGYPVFIYHTVEKVTIPNCIQLIGESAFSQCPNLSSVVIRADNYFFEEEDGMVYKKGKNELVFTPATKKNVTILPETTVIEGGGLGSLVLESLVIPGTVKTLGASALAFSSIDNLTIEEGVKTIGNRAFEKVTTKLPVVLPSSVTSLGNFAFNASNIGSVTLPEGLTEIPRYCFRESRIQKMVVPESVTTIREQAFFYCRFLTNISLPAHITSIESDAFDSPIAITRHIYFAGSEKRWKAIKFGSAIPSWNTIHFGDYPDDSTIPVWSEDNSMNAANLVSGKFAVWATMIVAIICHIKQVWEH